MAASDSRLRAASSRLAALTRHRPPDDPAVAAARHEVREAQLAAAERDLAALHASAQTDRDGTS
jgi:hypothetical protein